MSIRRDQTGRSSSTALARSRTPSPCCRCCRILPRPASTGRNATTSIRPFCKWFSRPSLPFWGTAAIPGSRVG